MSVAFLEKGNPNITWETNTNFNAGIEFGVLQNRISGSIEYFNRKTTDMLMAFPTAPSLGYSSYYANVGDMSNKGIEVDLNFTPIRSKNVQWDINVNLTHLKNKIISLPPERRTKEVEGYYGYAGSSFFYGQGLPLYTFHMKKYAGVSEDGRSMWYKDVKDKDGKPTGERRPPQPIRKLAITSAAMRSPTFTAASARAFRSSGSISASTSTTRSAARSTTRGMPQR